MITRNNILKNESITLAGVASLILIISTPFMRMTFQGRGLLTFSIAISLALLVLYFVFHPSKLKTIRLHRERTPIIVLSILFMFSPLLSPFAVSFSLDSIKVQLCTIMIFSIFLNNREKRMLIIISFIASLIFIWCYFFSSDYYYGGIRKWIVLQNEVWLDPNMVIASFIVPVLASVDYIVKKKNLIIKSLLLIYIGFSLYGAFLGGSRGGLLGILVGAIVLVLIELRKNVKAFVPVAIFLILLVLILPYITSFIPEALLNRMTLSSIEETGGSGRLAIYFNHVNHFFQDSNLFRLIFGYGKESCKNILGVSAHNTFIDYLWDLGLLGLSFYIYVLVVLFRCCCKSKSSLSLAILIASIVWSATISASDQLLFWVLLYTSYCLAENKKNNSNYARNFFASFGGTSN